MKRIHAVLLMLAVALGVLAVPAPALAAVGDTFTEPITIGNEKIDCVFAITGSNTVSVGEGGFDAHSPERYDSYYINSAKTALPKVYTQIDTEDYYIGDGCGAVTIPSTITHGGTTYSVTAIAPGAFWKASGITSVSIPSSVTSIGEGAFAECEALASVTIPSSVTAIPDCCFEGCSALRTIEGAANVTSIGASAYRSCNALHSVTIPSKVTSIGACAFLGCDALAEVSMGNAVTSVGNYAFAMSDALESVTLSTSLTTLPDYLFIQDYNLATVKNTSQITSMGQYVFSQCSNLRSFTIPSGLKTIPEDAFSGTGLLSITIPDGVELIDEYAFNGCHNLRSVTFPTNSSCKLSYMAFANCTSLETLDLSHVSELVTTYYNWGSQFSSCTGLTSVTIGDQITNIPDGTFYGCTSLTSITIPSQVTALGDGALGECTGLNSVTIPANVTSLDNETFEESHSLVALVLEGNAVKTLNGTWSPTYAHAFTEGFGRIYVPDSLVDAYKSDEKWSEMADYIVPMSDKPSDTHIYALLKKDGTLVHCDSSGKEITGGTSFIVDGNASSDYAKYAVTDIKFESGITEIPLGAFAYCKALKSVSLPSGVTSIGENAFYECSALQSVSGSGVTSVEYRAFDACPGLRSVGFMSKLTDLGRYAFRGCKALASVSLKSDLSEIGDSAFYGCTNLDQVTLPTSATYFIIGSNAFSDCTALQSISLPTQVAQLGQEAFSGSGLTSVNAPGVLFSMGTGVFRQCRHLTSASGSYIQNSMFKDCAALRSVTIADGVSEIYGSAFSGCGALQSIEFPSGLDDIDEYAFMNCSGLWSIELPEGIASLSSCFAWCSGLSSVTLPGSLSYVSGNKSGNETYGVFSECTGLSSVTFGDGYSANIGGAMFMGCAALRSIQIPDAVAEIGSYAFNGCSLLKNLQLPASLSYLGDDCFASCLCLTEMDLSFAEGLNLDTYYGGQFGSCFNLKKVTLPEGLVAVSPAMFAGCTSLTEITIPAGIDYVGSVAFRSCKALQTVVFENDCSVCEFSDSYGDVFRNCDALSKVVFREKKPQDGAVTFPDGVTFYYTVRYYPMEELASDRANCIGQLTVKAGTNVMGTSAPAASAIYDGTWVQASTAEPAITATSLSNSGWACPGTWTGVLFVTQPEGGETADGSFSLSAEARVRRVTGSSATDTGDAVTYAWYECDAQGAHTGAAKGTGATLALTGLSEGRHYYVCVASSAASGLSQSSANSQVACVNVKTGRLSVSPETITYRWPVGRSTSGYGPTFEVTNTSSFTIKNIKWKSKNGYFEIYGNTQGDWGDVDAGVSFNPTIHPNVPDAEPREYQDTLIITSDNAIKVEVPVILKFYDESGAYADFSFGPKTGMETYDTIIDFGTLEEGYSNPRDTCSVNAIVWPEGGSLTFTGRTNPSHFDVYNENMSSYPRTISSGSGLKIAPKAGLAAGSYEDTFTYSYKDENGKSGSLTITLKLKVRGGSSGGGGISVSPTSCDWGSADEGYAAPASKTITVTNSGSSAITLPSNTGSGLTAFTVSGASGLSIPAGQSKTFTVAPKTGLSAGSYSETLTLAPSGVSSKSVTLSFTVNKVTQAGNCSLDSLEFSTGELSPRFASGTYAYTLTLPQGTNTVSLSLTQHDYYCPLSVGIQNGDIDYDGNGYVLTVENGTKITIECGDKSDDTYFNVKTYTINVEIAYPKKWERLAGKDRYETMGKIVDAGMDGWTPGRAVLATGQNFPDALVASSVAGELGCPVVLTWPNKLTDEAKAKLQELDVKEVWIMGSNKTVSDDVVRDLVDMGIERRWISRIEGSNRQETSLEAMRWLDWDEEYDGTVVIASGFSFPDALAIGPWCYANRVPILLAGKDGGLTDSQWDALAGIGLENYTQRAKRVIILGGKDRVSEETEYVIRTGIVIPVMRIAGSSRYETAQMIAEWEMEPEQGMSATNATVAKGSNFPDALAGAALCGQNQSVLLLVNGDEERDNSFALDVIGADAAEVELGYALGDENSVTANLFRRLNDLTAV